MIFVNLLLRSALIVDTTKVSKSSCVLEFSFIFGTLSLHLNETLLWCPMSCSVWLYGHPDAQVWCDSITTYYTLKSACALNMDACSIMNASSAGVYIFLFTQASCQMCYLYIFRGMAWSKWTASSAGPSFSFSCCNLLWLESSSRQAPAIRCTYQERIARQHQTSAVRQVRG